MPGDTKPRPNVKGDASDSSGSSEGRLSLSTKPATNPTASRRSGRIRGIWRKSSNSTAKSSSAVRTHYRRRSPRSRGRRGKDHQDEHRRRPPRRGRASRPCRRLRWTNDAMNSKSPCCKAVQPERPVVARLANDVLREAVGAVNGPGAILDVADLAAPSIVEAVLSRNTHQFATAGIEFVVWGRKRRAAGRYARSTPIWRRWRSSAARTRPNPARWCRALDATSASMPATGPR